MSGGRSVAAAYPVSVSLLALAGWVDAVGFLHWQGVYVSFMSGNTTQMAISGAAAEWGRACLGAEAIAGFIAGVVLGELTGGLAGPRRMPIVLGLEALLLAAAAVFTAGASSAAAVRLLLAAAMGVQNAALGSAGPPTYVTGTLVRLGRAAAAAFTGNERWRTVLSYAGMWLALLAGAVAGAATAGRLVPAACIVLPAAAALLLAGAGWRSANGRASGSGQPS